MFPFHPEQRIMEEKVYMKLSFKDRWVYESTELGDSLGPLRNGVPG